MSCWGINPDNYYVFRKIECNTIPNYVTLGNLFGLAKEYKTGKGKSEP